MTGCSLTIYQDILNHLICHLIPHTKLNGPPLCLCSWVLALPFWPALDSLHPLGALLSDLQMCQCPPRNLGFSGTGSWVMALIVPEQNTAPICVLSLVYHVGKMGLGKGLPKIQLNREGFEQAGPEEGHEFFFIVSLSVL